MPAAYDEALLTTADGPRVHYRVYPAEGLARGTPVLCLHGLTRNERDFEDLAPMIAALGRRVIVASQRGRGLSDRDQDPDRYTAGVYVGDMLALLDSLAVDKAVFVGTSMGGLITFVAATQAPHRLAAAVINDVGPELDPRGIERIAKNTGAPKSASTWAEAAAVCRANNGVAFPGESEAFWTAFARRAFREAGPGRLELDYDLAIARGVQPPPEGAPAAPSDLWPLFDALKDIPTLVIRGALSDLLAAETLAKMRQRRPDLQTVTVPNVGHAPFMTEPAAWAALCQFLVAAP